MLEGKTTACADYQEAVLEKGDLFIAFPNQIHNYFDLEPIRCILLIFPQDLCPDYSSLLNSHVPVIPVIKSSRCPENLLSILEAILANNCSNSPCHASITKGYFTVLLGILLEIIPLKKIESNDLDTVRSILTYCNENYHNDLSLDTIADDLHINKFYISHLFGQKLKIGFNDFINSLRVDEACKRLTGSDSSITEIAYQVGFNSIRSFNRAFHNQTGVTPREYRLQPVSPQA